VALIRDTFSGGRMSDYKNSRRCEEEKPH